MFSTLKTTHLVSLPFYSNEDEEAQKVKGLAQGHTASLG
jgi:hypothetical protein